MATNNITAPILTAQRMAKEIMKYEEELKAKKAAEEKATADEIAKQLMANKGTPGRATAAAQRVLQTATLQDRKATEAKLNSRNQIDRRAAADAVKAGMEGGGYGTVQPYKAGTSFASGANVGITGLNTGIQQIGSTFIGKPIEWAGRIVGGLQEGFGGDRDNAVTDLANYLQRSKTAANKAHQQAMTDSTLPSWLNTTISAVMQSAPDMAMDIMLGGFGKAVSGVGKAGRMLDVVDPVKAEKLGDAVRANFGLGKDLDPLQLGGRVYNYTYNQYAENKAKGMDDATALSQALLYAIPASLVESGGVQKTAKNLGGEGVRGIIKDVLGEGGEEALQTLISNVATKQTADPDMKLVSLDPNEPAVANVPELAANFALGAAAGGVMGGAVRLPGALNSDPAVAVNQFVQGIEKLNEQSGDFVSRLATAANVPVVVEDIASPTGATVNGYIKDGVVHINSQAANPEAVVAGHEITHHLQEVAADDYMRFRDYVKQIRGITDAEIAAKQAEYANAGVQLTADEAMDEIAADFAGELMTNQQMIEQMVLADRNLAQRIYDALRNMVRNVQAAFGNTGAQLEKAVNLWGKALKNAEGAGRFDAETRYSFEGYDSVTGKGVYRSNFPKGTPKTEKGARILNYIQNVWSKQPIDLVIRNNDGTERHIKAQFDPTYSEDKRVPSDATKLMGGNRHGNATEQRVALDLADDYYQIASESKYNRSKPEEGKTSIPHQNVKEWHYFINDILFQEQESTKKTPYRITINVKERDDGQFVYSFSADRSEKIEKEPSTRQTLHADVNQSVNTGEVNAQPSIDIVPDNGGNVNPRYSLSVDEETKKANAKTALDYFGKTYSWKETGYLLQDGTKLDFSGKKFGSPSGYRSMDHRDISDALGDDYGDGSYSGGMIQFMQEGNIRISPESDGINLATMPTKAQETALRDYISRVRGEVIVDIDDANGNTVFSMEYPRGTSSTKVLADIRQYFEDGTEPYVSPLAQFRYSLSPDQPDGKAAEAQQMEQKPPKQLYEEVKAAKKSVNKVVRSTGATDEDLEVVSKLLTGELHPNAIADMVNSNTIKTVYEAKKQYEEKAKEVRQYKVDLRKGRFDKAVAALGDILGYKDKKAGIMYARETQERNIRDIAPDKETADRLIEEFFAPVHKNEAERIRFANDYRQRVKRLGLSRKIEYGNIVSESHAVQLLGEAMYNQTVAKSTGEAFQGKTEEEWGAVIKALKDGCPKMNWGKIYNAVNEFRQIYDELFNMMNDARIAAGYEPIPYRKGYFPHFQPNDGGGGLLGAFCKALGINGDVQSLPTTINGLTHTFTPGIRWIGNTQQRFGFGTVYDAVEGFDKYIEGVSDVIHHTDDIQNLRALEDGIRYLTSEEGIKERIEKILADPEKDTDEVTESIAKIAAESRTALSNYVVNLHEYTNGLANKRSQNDRGVESDVGRGIYNLTQRVMSRVAANMVAINPGSWITNIIPLAQGGSELSTIDFLKGLGGTLHSMISGDGFVDRSDFLTNRQGSDPLVKSYEQSSNAPKILKAAGGVSGKIGDTLSSPMQIIDSIVTETLVRARYEQNKKGGKLSDAEAMAEADRWAASVMGDRSKGAQPTLFNRKNPIAKTFTSFQLEINNEWSHILKDLPDKNKGLRLGYVLLKYMLGAFLFNELYEYVIGRRPALDPIGLLNESAGNYTGYELPNLVELATGEDREFATEKQSFVDATGNTLKSAAGNVPFVGGLLEGGRLPISSAIPDVVDIANTMDNENLTFGQKAADIGGELGGTVGAYVLAPFGGGQAKKLVQGAQALAEGGSYTTNKDGERQLQYYVPQDTTGEKVGSAVKTILFGKSSLDTAQDWIESGFKSLGANQTAAFDALVELGTPQEKAYRLVTELSQVEGDKDENGETIDGSRKAKQLEYLDSDKDVSDSQKAVIFRSLLASEKQGGQFAKLDSLGVSDAEAYRIIRGIGEADGEKDDKGETISGSVTAEKLKVITDSNMTEDQQAEFYIDNVASDDAVETYSAFAEVGVDPVDIYRLQVEGYKVSKSYIDDLPGAIKAGLDPYDYLQYCCEYADTEGDKDGNGKTISGTKKRKVLKMIDEMEISSAEKDYLFLLNYAASGLSDTPWHGGYKIVPTVQEIKSGKGTMSRPSFKSKFKRPSFKNR